MKQRYALAVLAIVLSFACVALPREEPSQSPTPTTAAEVSPATTTEEPTEEPAGEFDCEFAVDRADSYVDPGDDTASWQFSTPEAQGMDAAILEAGASSLEALPYTFSYLVIRDDAIVLERYFNGSQANHSNNLRSASKSILSALVGIAIREGYIESVDQPVAELLPTYFSGQEDARKNDILVRHLLTMSAGLEWEENGPIHHEVVAQPDVVQAIVDLQLVDLPGETFNYSQGLSHLMSAALTEASGMSTCEFAYRYLFGPLDISVEYWAQDRSGYFVGGSEMFITPREMAKFGLLYLHDGDWQGRQVVPVEWVAESLQPYMETGNSRGEYGYYWWINSAGSHDCFTAFGFGGQTVHVIPDLDLVVVATADSSGSQREVLPASFVEEYVIAAVTD